VNEIEGIDSKKEYIKQTDSPTPTWLYYFLQILLGLPYIVFLLFVSHNGFASPVWVGEAGMIAILISCAIYRIIYQKRAHVISWSAAWLSLVNWIIAAGGFSYLRTWGLIVLGIGFTAGTWFFMRWSKWPLAVARSLIVFSIVGILLLQVNRDLWFSNLFGLCHNLKTSKCFTFIDKEKGPYDGLILDKPSRVMAVYGEGEGLKIISLEKGEILFKRRLLGSQRITLAPDGHILSAAWGRWGKNESLEVLDQWGQTQKTFQLQGCTNAFEAAIVDDDAYVVCEMTNSLSVLKYSDGMPSDVIPLPGKNAYSVGSDPIRGKIWVSFWYSSDLVRVDAKTKKVDGIVHVGFSQFQVKVIPGDKVYVALPIRSEVAAINPVTLKIVQKYKVGLGVRDIEIIPSRDLLFALNYYDSTLDILRLSDGKRLARHNTARLSRGIAISSDGKFIAVFTGCGILKASVDDLLRTK